MRTFLTAKFYISTHVGQDHIDTIYARPNLSLPAPETAIKQTWHFHVVLLHKGLIYDYDYGPNNQAVPLLQYFKNMFGAELVNNGQETIYQENTEQTYHDEYDEPTPEKESRLRMHVRAISADIYEKEYSFNRNHSAASPQVKNYAYWVYGDARFPDLTIEEFLRFFEN